MKKRIIALAAVMMLIVSAFTLASCSARVTLAGEIDENGKEAQYEANKADKDDYMLHGVLVVEEGEQVVIDSHLEKGSIQFDFVKSEGEGDMETMPDTEGMEAAYTATASGTESQTLAFAEGEYMIKATVTEDGTTGDVEIEVED